VPIDKEIKLDSSHYNFWFTLGRKSKGVLVKKLYVGNLPFKATEQDLVDWFTQAGVTAPTITLVRDQATGQLRGFGFVEVSNDEEAARAVQSLNGQDLMGRNVVVNEARPRESGGGGGRGGYGGGGRDGGRDGGGGRGRDGGGGGGGRNRRF
jgi:RNA recognition motif-containing protein